MKNTNINYFTETLLHMTQTYSKKTKIKSVNTVQKRIGPYVE